MDQPKRLKNWSGHLLDFYSQLGQCQSGFKKQFILGSLTMQKCPHCTFYLLTSFSSPTRKFENQNTGTLLPPNLILPRIHTDNSIVREACCYFPDRKTLLEPPVFWSQEKVILPTPPRFLWNLEDKSLHRPGTIHCHLLN